jgi:cyclophilin family peptidyl-prolyl cis-trans isomerase
MNRVRQCQHRRMSAAQLSALLMALVVSLGQTPVRPFFTSPYSPSEMANKQAVIETTAGTFVIQLRPDVAPNHVAHFIKTASDGGYTGTTFHRVIRYGIIQGGDPLSKDPAKAAQYGTGGLNELKAEFNAEKHTAGAVSAVLVPGKPDSAGAQFFVCASDQPALDGQYTVFGRVVDGLEVVQQISAVDADATGVPKTRVVITSVTIRDTPPEPFLHDTAAELGTYHVTLETTKGTIELAMLADKAPETVRAFLRMVAAGIYDGVAIHRVVPNFVIQTGALAFRGPLTLKQQQLVHNLAPEFSDTSNVPGIVSMAHGEDPASGTTSFFICTGECHQLDGKYTAFARVVGGMDVLMATANVAVNGEEPREKMEVVTARVRREKAESGK